MRWCGVRNTKSCSSSERHLLCECEREERLRARAYGGVAVGGLDDELLAAERDVAHLTPGEADARREPASASVRVSMSSSCTRIRRQVRVFVRVGLLVDVDAERVDAEQEVGALLVLDLEVVDAIHLEVLRDLQVLEHGLLAACSSSTVLSCS